jgi:hypothetical protein
VLAHNIAQVEHLLTVGTLFVAALQRVIRVTFAFGADDQGLRLITGLASSSSIYCCFYCYFIRNLNPTLNQCYHKRSSRNAIELAATGDGGHECQPLLKNAQWSAYKMCVLHALMAMGRVFCKWLFDWLGWLEMESNSTRHWDYAQAWLKNINVNINITKPPANQSWNCKGTFILLHIVPNSEVGIFTMRMWATLSVLAPYLSIPVNVLKSVALMKKAFHVLYIFDFSSPINQHKLKWYVTNIAQVAKSP